MKRKLVVFLTACLLISFSLSNSDSFAAGGYWKADSNGWWYEYSDGSYAMGWTEIDGYWYYFLGSGYMDYSEYRDGCWLNADGTWNTAYSGGYWASNSTGWWYTDASGWYPVNTWLWIDGSCYYFKADGYMAVNEWIDGYYVKSSGEISTEAPTEAPAPVEKPHGVKKDGVVIATFETYEEAMAYFDSLVDQGEMNISFY